jgi:phosphopantothenoylcysteine synthetase/decarboxylase
LEKVLGNLPQCRSLPRMNCLVTAGPTYEPLDQVRRLTNFSTGRLGLELAEFLTARGLRVTLLIGEQATWAGPRRATEVVTFSTTADLETKLRARASGEVDAVFHAAAVSDFQFGRAFHPVPGGALEEIKAGKLSTRTGTLLVELVPTPKLLPQMRDWFPAARITGWKYEVDGNRAAALARAGEQLAAARTDACVVNGSAYGPGFGLLTREVCRDLANRTALFAALLEWVANGRIA